MKADRRGSRRPIPDDGPGLDPRGGTYVLILHAARRAVVTFRRGSSIATRPGYYTYVGSAFGPGGIRARVSRHARTDKRRHWHIDHLTAVTQVTGAMISYACSRYEHGWAAYLEDMTALEAVAGFGCTDCRCHSHLYYTADDARLALALQGLPGRPRRWVNPLTAAAAVE